ncbi:N-acetylmuramoyl-L-alanine amidase [Halalkalibacillus halophilus]|uniref:N-acetylmuramoyl-L-alanine amidase n=1 Tax=Halalkalibacillus halophilus TaxID=392827 RepID=UPI0004106486|nr:N-acetylmuramoyl-L-alanine amidase [Halalkalibacillus halophilus]
MGIWIQDAGHGGADPGAVYDGVQEKDWTLEAALYVYNRLREIGIETAVTRKKDITLPRNERTSMVKRYSHCISHHFNAGKGNGFEAIHSMYSSGGFEHHLLKVFQKEGYPVRRVFTRSLPTNMKQDYYFMHRETGNCQVTIIEYDFLDGPNRTKLKNPSYRKKMYELVVKAIADQEGKSAIPIHEEISTERLYRVICGAYHKQSNALNQVKKLSSAGFDSFIEEKTLTKK